MQAHTTDYIKGSCTQFNLHVENIQMSVTQPPQLKMSFNWGGCVQQRVGENAVSVHVASLAHPPQITSVRLSRPTVTASVSRSLHYLALLEHPLLGSLCAQFLDVLEHVKDDVFNMHCSDTKQDPERPH